LATDSTNFRSALPFGSSGVQTAEKITFQNLIQSFFEVENFKLPFLKFLKTISSSHGS
jgi:hypothetical protein